MKRTKIVCTIGPASEKPAILEKMIKAGMNVARLNFSHGSYANHRLLIKNIRAVAKKLGEPVALLQDLQGPRLRLGTLPAEGVKLVVGEQVCLIPESEMPKTVTEKAKNKFLSLQYETLYKHLAAGNNILIKDGTINLKVDRIIKSMMLCTVVAGGLAISHNGINLPGVHLEIPVITEKDRADLDFGIKNEVDYVALSFVQNERDIKDLRQLITKLVAKYKVKTTPKIIAKIERREAINNFSGILAATDGVMVARGDMGIELSPADVPIIQKHIIHDCLRAAKPVIVATQMLESMKENLIPTRAEASDVANAVIDHTDAVMLSAESATGKHPVETVKMMSEIIGKAEDSPFDNLFSQKKFAPLGVLWQENIFEYLTRGVEQGVKVIVLATGYWELVKEVVRQRPEKPIVVLWNGKETIEQLNLLWGVFPAEFENNLDSKKTQAQAIKLLQKKKMVKKGDLVLVVCDSSAKFANNQLSSVCVKV